MARRITMTRRRFLAASAGAFSILGVAARSYGRIRGACSRLDLGIIGVANRGKANLDAVEGENIVALCDVDETCLAAALKAHPGAATFFDFRRMLESAKLDAVVVSTPDHVHAPAAAMALRTGRHVYCEKPLAHTVAEARALANLARETGRITQMGTQIHAGENYRRVVEIIRSGAIGAVEEVHVWVDRVWSGKGRPKEVAPPPKTLHWDLWLGPAPKRAWSTAYAPGGWRGFWDFGNGTLGDMACHHMDLPVWALDLGAPESVEAEGPPPDTETAPPTLAVRYRFPASGKRSAVTLTWRHGGARPPHFDAAALPKWGDGTLFVGKSGLLLADYNRFRLFPEEKFEGYGPPEPSIPRSIGHHAEWLAACRGEGTTTCPFERSGPLTETVLLGAVAFRSRSRLSWKAASLDPGSRAAERFLRREYRDGWTL